MTKEEYSLLHYLLAKLKFTLANDIKNITNQKVIDKNISLINSINEIEKIMIIGDE